eukprot:Plantae.Rhodophyta-Hildenbrandia_rubra.ctg5892.p1 GENE.Plantae.Rhodophyta-Hildenbrandia_rubra.ctg5892~~Plantae.Rhodophyta-Hildenbrandia_rubra.ctg5892.p1  ORF type:complete len:433 (+),score=63.36 Plantae.Rhodophyta-Hildenbrandia_rubra.ctg5892:2323-3621(+)
MTSIPTSPSPPLSPVLNGIHPEKHLAGEGTRVRLHFHAQDLVTPGLRSSNIFYGQVYVRSPAKSPRVAENDQMSSRSNSSGAAGSAIMSVGQNGKESCWVLLGRTERRRRCGKQVEWCKQFDTRYIQGARMKVRLAVYDATPRLKGGDRLVAIADFRLDEMVRLKSKCEVDMKFVMEGGRDEGNEVRVENGSPGKSKKKRKSKPRKGPAGTATITTICIDKPPTMYHFQIESDPIVLLKTMGKKKVKAALYTIRTRYDVGDGDGSLILLHQSDPAFLVDHNRSVGSLSDNPFTSVSVRSEGISHPTEKVESAPTKQGHRQRLGQMMKKGGEKKRYIIFNWSSVLIFGENHDKQEVQISFCASDGDKYDAHETIAEGSTTIHTLRNLEVGESIPVTLYDTKKKARTGRLRLQQIERGDDPKYFRLRFEVPDSS